MEVDTKAGSPGEGAARTRAYATIDRDALRHNLHCLRRAAPGCETIGVVKADAYGHGAALVGATLVAAGCERLAVVDLGELAELRSAGISAPVLVLGPISFASEDECQRAAALAPTPVLHGAPCLDTARALAAASTSGPLAVHVEVDTGMRRMGVPAAEAAAFAAEVAREPGLSVEGVFTHFAAADADSLDATLAQCERFRSVLAELREQGIEPPLVHTSNSAGVLAGERVRRAVPEETAIRPGLALYGVRPAPHLGPELAPVMTVRAPVVQIHSLAAGDGVGYGSRYRAEAPTRVATLAVGYADGVPWTAANRGRVWLAGEERTIAGRVSMDYTSVVIGDASVSIGDEAILFGRDENGNGVAVEDAAVHDGAFDYELLVRVGRRVPRVAVGAGD